MHRALAATGGLIVLLLLGTAPLAGGCRGKRSGGTSQTPAPPAPHVTGKCENVYLNGASCRLDLVLPTEIDPGRQGLKVVEVSHETSVSSVTHHFRTFQLTVPEGRVEELEAFFKRHSPVRCDGVIIRPPCNPDGTAVKLQLALPDYAKPYR